MKNYKLSLSGANPRTLKFQAPNNKVAIKIATSVLNAELERSEGAKILNLTQVEQGQVVLSTL